MTHIRFYVSITYYYFKQGRKVENIGERVPVYGVAYAET